MQKEEREREGEGERAFNRGKQCLSHRGKSDEHVYSVFMPTDENSNYDI